MKFKIEFLGPMRVSTGLAGPGVDATVDPNCLLPASSLKGVMRESARWFFDEDLVDKVFGSASSPSPWGWCEVEFDNVPKIMHRARVAIGESGTAIGGALMFQEEAWPDIGYFEVEQILPTKKMDQHRKVLTVAAHGVHALGADRNRGLGWVEISRCDINATVITECFSEIKCFSNTPARGDN